MLGRLEHSSKREGDGKNIDELRIENGPRPEGTRTQYVASFSGGQLQG
jgi:hypothetical protein